MTNVHDIAIELEKILCEEFGFESRPRNTIFDADLIELCMFYDDMVLLLHKKGHGDYLDFQNSIYKYKHKDMNKIPDCEGIFEKFKSYLT